MVDLAELQAVTHLTISAPPGTLYDMVSDITRMGEWSPECTGGAWDDGAGPWVGGWFVGQNRAGDFEWETRSEVVVAEPGHEFVFVVGGGAAGDVRWGYRFEPVGGATRVEESWMVRSLSSYMADRSDDELLAIRASRHEGMEQTLANLKRVAEAAG
jgi:hypothetical protein